MSEPQVARKFEPDQAPQYIREVLLLLSPEALGNLAYHLSAGHTLHAGPTAYKWSGVKSGCLLTLAVSRETLADVLDFQTAKRIEEPAMKLYGELVHKVGLEFYIATANMKSSELQQLIVDFLKEKGNNSLSAPEVTYGP